jgi:hypothetical protein
MKEIPEKHKLSYTDDELKDILSHSPTRENLKKLSEKYRRTENALREVFRWANYTKTKLIERKKWNTFTQHIKRICAEIGLMRTP